MSSQPAVSVCSRCGHQHIGVPIAPALGALHWCAVCGRYTLVREMGEMTRPDDRADESWGGVGWQ